MENTNSTNKKDKVLQTLVNIGTVVLFIFIIVVIYKFFIVRDYSNLREGFQDKKLNKDRFENTLSNTKTIYETSLETVFGNNKRLLCNMLPSMNENTNVCKVDDEPYIIYKFPIHIIKLIDGSILAVFNDGRMYQKDKMSSTMWKGPIVNSMPQGTVPLRMVSLSTDLKTLLGVGYNNILYLKEPKELSEGGGIHLSGEWKQVPNNSNIIYVLYDNKTNFLLSIDTNGKLFTKQSFDITSDNSELTTTLNNKPILRLYYDLNGNMFFIDTKFELYKFKDTNWKTSEIRDRRGVVGDKLQDMIYDNDGKMYGIVFNPETFIAQIMKQTSTFYLSSFKPLHLLSNSDKWSTNFVMSDQDIIKCKIGSIFEYITTIANHHNNNDDDPNFAYHKEIIDSKNRLRQFCANRGSNTQNINYDNYELLSSVENNSQKIGKLKNVIQNLMVYEPEKDRIEEKYSILNK
jgi:hypothetical protein